VSPASPCLPLIEARGIVKAYGRTSVLRGASFEVRPGEIVGIVGENGSGKSTLLRIVVGLLRPSAGTVRLRGRLGYCDQEPLLFPLLTVAEHFRYFASAYGLRDARRWQDTKRMLLDRFGYARWEHTLVEHLSGGTRQKLNLSIALLHQPDLVVLDEPYLAFDWETYLRFWDHAAELRAAGRALVIVSHLAHDQARFDRLLALREGVLQCA
jgi:ABC-type multidrug transport system ATPase subunit